MEPSVEDRLYQAILAEDLGTVSQAIKNGKKIVNFHIDLNYVVHLLDYVNYNNISIKFNRFHDKFYHFKRLYVQIFYLLTSYKS